MSANNKHWRFWNRIGSRAGIFLRLNEIVCLGVFALCASLTIASDYVVLVDTSDSMTEAISKTNRHIRITTVQEVLRNFIGALPSDTRICLISFSKGVRSEQEVVLRGVQERQKAMEWIDHLATEAKEKGNDRTYLWTSLSQALEVATRYAKDNPKQPVILRALTDGQDNQGVTTLRKVLDKFPLLDGKSIRGNLFILGDFEIKIPRDPRMPPIRPGDWHIIIPPIIGCNPPRPKINEEVSFCDNSNFPYTQYTWTIDGQPIGQQKSVTYVFKKAGSYKVELTAKTANVPDQVAAPLDVKIDQPLEPDFTFTPSEPEPGQETKFFGKSSGKFVSCAWFVNGKSIATLPDCTTTFDKEGDHEVKFAVTDDSKHTTEKVRTVHVVEPILKPAFKTLREVAPGQEVLFANETSGPAKSFEWDFGDGEKSAERDPTHIFKNESKTPRQYTIVLQATTQGGKRFQSDPWIITVKPQPPPERPPVAKFRVNGDRLKAGTPVEFVDESTGLIASYRWDFGGEGSGTEKNPHFTFEQATNTTIRLTVEGPGGKSSTETVLEIASKATSVTINWLDRHGKTVSLPSVIDLRKVLQQNVKSGQYARPLIDTFEIKQPKDLPQGGGVSASFDGTAGKAFQVVKLADGSKRVPAASLISNSGRFRLALQPDAPAGVYSGNLLIQPQPGPDQVLVNGSAKPMSIPVKLEIGSPSKPGIGTVLLVLLALAAMGYGIWWIMNKKEPPLKPTEPMQVAISEVPLAAKGGQPGEVSTAAKSQSFTLMPFQTIAFCRPGGQMTATHFYSYVNVSGAFLLRQTSGLELKKGASSGSAQTLKRADTFELTDTAGKRHMFKITWQGSPQQKQAIQNKQNKKGF